MEIIGKAEKEIAKKQKYLKRKIGVNCSGSQIVELAMSIAERVGGDWGYVSEWNHGGTKK